MSELDHNEVVGWTPPFGERHAVIALRHDGEDDEIRARFELSLPIAERAGAITRQVRARGDGDLARLFSLIAVGDLMTTYLAILRDVDPTPVDVITSLKAALAARA
jgi:glucose/mannose-6-phosphate isomerase